jgi:hypothetical protein
MDIQYIKLTVRGTYEDLGPFQGYMKEMLPKQSQRRYQMSTCDSCKKTFTNLERKKSVPWKRP